MNSGTTKLSTIHSFKGWEIHTLFLIIDNPSTDDNEPHHISGEQLCQGIRELAIRRWGLMARSVLNHWNIKATRDFGEIVFLLVENNWMQKEPDDTISDFDDVYDFAEKCPEKYLKDVSDYVTRSRKDTFLFPMKILYDLAEKREYITKIAN